MYIDERLIKILETHKEEQIHVTYAIDLIKKIAKEYEAQATPVVTSCYAVIDEEGNILELSQTKEKADKRLRQFKNDFESTEFYVDTLNIK